MLRNARQAGPPLEKGDFQWLPLWKSGTFSGFFLWQGGTLSAFPPLARWNSQCFPPFGKKGGNINLPPFLKGDRGGFQNATVPEPVSMSTRHALKSTVLGSGGGMLLSQQYWGQGGFRKFIHKKGPGFLARGLVSFVVFVT
jgi:hypothetical protein